MTRAGTESTLNLDVDSNLTRANLHDVISKEFETTELATVSTETQFERIGEGNATSSATGGWIRTGDEVVAHAESVLRRHSKSRKRQALNSRLSRHLSEFRYLTGLNDNWDGEGSPGYSHSTFRRATDLLRAYCIAAEENHACEIDLPELRPGPDGDIELYWKTSEFEALLTVPADVNMLGDYYVDDYDGLFGKGSFRRGEVREGLLEWLVRKV